MPSYTIQLAEGAAGLGLPDMLKDLIGQNLVAHPEKVADFNKLAIRIGLTVVDAAGDSPAPCVRWFNDLRFVTPEPAGNGSGSQPASDPTETVPCLCDGDYYDCSSFGGPTAAQECFEYCVKSGQGDIHHLDQDEDGSACNSG